MNAPFWNDERLKQLEELWRNPDLSAAQIGARMGTTKNSIISKASRTGLAAKYPKNTPKGPRPKVAAAPVPQPDPVPAPPPRPVERIPAAGVHLFDLKAHHCRWMNGSSSSMRFCGKPVANKSYCEEHAKRVYTIPPPKVPKKRAAR